MDDQILAIYCLCDDVLKALYHWKNPQRQMTDAEVITTGVGAALYFRGNRESARRLLAAPRYLPALWSKSRLNHRWHALRDLMVYLFQVLGSVFKPLNASSVSIIDSFPIAAWDNLRIPQAKLYTEADYCGYYYTANKRCYFDGLKLYLLVTADGHPVEVFLVPGSTADVHTLADSTSICPKAARSTPTAPSLTTRSKPCSKRQLASTSSPCARKTPNVPCRPSIAIFHGMKGW